MRPTIFGLPTQQEVHRFRQALPGVLHNSWRFILRNSIKKQKFDPNKFLRVDNPEQKAQEAKDFWSVVAWLVGMAATIGLAYWSNFAVFVYLPMALMLEKIIRPLEKERRRQETGRIPEERIVTAIRTAFTGNGVEVHHRVQIGERQDLDIFVRFPQSKDLFAVSVKHWGEGKVVYHEERDTLCFRKRNRGLAYMNDPDPLKELRDHEWWLRKNRRDVFGGSSRDTKRPVRKVMVFAEPTLIQKHRDHLYTTIGDQKFVKIERENSTVFLLCEEQIVDFIRLNLIS